jgi:hypothetical protein
MNIWQYLIRGDYYTAYEHLIAIQFNIRYMIIVSFKIHC